MRKHSVRKWLHAILDLLPLFVIPIFAIYSRNENAQFGYEVTINESYWEVKNKYETNEVLDENTDLIEGNIYHISNLYFNNLDDDYTFTISLVHFEEFTTHLDSNLDFNLNDLILNNYNSNDNNILTLVVDSGEINILPTNSSTFADITLIEYDIQFSNVDFIIDDLGNFNYYNYTYNRFDVLSTDFNVYEYIYHENEPVTYNDTDIGSQMIYTLYNTVDKYFNMNNVFNMGSIWNWVNNNMFGGGAPLSAYIVYQIIAYELIMDIIFLIYTVMMFIVDFAEKGIDRFLGRSC